MRELSVAYSESSEFNGPWTIGEVWILWRNDGKDSLSLLLVVVDQYCCHFLRADRLRCSLISDRVSGVTVSRRLSIAAAAMPSTRLLPAMPMCDDTEQREKDLVLLMIALWMHWTIGLVGCIDPIAWRAQQESNIIVSYMLLLYIGTVGIMIAFRMAMSSAMYMVAIECICFETLW